MAYYIVVEPSEEGWICYNVENREEVDRVISNGGHEIPQQEAKEIFGQFMNIVSPVNTIVSSDGSKVTFIRPSDEELDEDEISFAKQKRSDLLKDTDFYFCSDYPLDDGKKEALKTYRQALRDITKQSGWPRNIKWPEKPNI